jgi:CheY-like chemotaxis protein
MKKTCSILVADTNLTHAGLLAKNLKAHGYYVLTARDPAHALSILEFRAFEILIVDMDTTGKDGTALVKAVKSIKPRPRIIAVGNGESFGGLKAFFDGKSEHFLAKPLQLDELLKVIAPSDRRSSFSGMVECVDLIDYLQFVMLGGGKTVLRVTSVIGTQAEIYLSGGAILHAVCGVLEGEQALYRCLGFKEGSFAHAPWENPERLTIKKPGEFLLMEAVRKRDEAWGDCW